MCATDKIHANRNNYPKFQYSHSNKKISIQRQKKTLITRHQKDKKSASLK